jgi:hypothetical protein
VITDARRVNELLVGLPDVIVLGVEEREGGQVAVHVEQVGSDRRVSDAARRRR